MLVLLNEKQLADDSVSKAVIYEKARKLYSYLLQENPSISATNDEFKASRWWFGKFHERSSILSMIHGEASSFDKAAAEACRKEFTKFMKAEGYVTQQLLNCDRTGLLEEDGEPNLYYTKGKGTAKAQAHEGQIDSWMCMNTNANLKIKPLLVFHSQTPSALKEQNVNKARLPVMWRPNVKAWVTRQLFMGCRVSPEPSYMHKVFVPTVKKYFYLAIQ